MNQHNNGNNDNLPYPSPGIDLSDFPILPRNGLIGHLCTPNPFTALSPPELVHKTMGTLSTEQQDQEFAQSCHGMTEAAGPSSLPGQMVLRSRPLTYASVLHGRPQYQGELGPPSSHAHQLQISEGDEQGDDLNKIPLCPQSVSQSLDPEVSGQPQVKDQHLQGASQPLTAEVFGEPQQQLQPLLEISHSWDSELSERNKLRSQNQQDTLQAPNPEVCNEFQEQNLHSQAVSRPQNLEVPGQPQQPGPHPKSISQTPNNNTGTRGRQVQGGRRIEDDQNKTHDRHQNSRQGAFQKDDRLICSKHPLAVNPDSESFDSEQDIFRSKRLSSPKSKSFAVSFSRYYLLI
jgi:hypothetical protein